MNSQKAISSGIESLLPNQSLVQSHCSSKLPSHCNLCVRTFSRIQESMSDQSRRPSFGRDSVWLASADVVAVLLAFVGQLILVTHCSQNRMVCLLSRSICLRPCFSSSTWDYQRFLLEMVQEIHQLFGQECSESIACKDLQCFFSHRLQYGLFSRRVHTIH